MTWIYATIKLPYRSCWPIPGPGSAGPWFPQAIDRPIVAQSGAMTLERAMKLGAAFVSKKSIQAALEELQAL